MDTATKIGLDTAKTVSNRVIQKITEVTGDFFRNKKTDKITSVSKTKGKEKVDERQEIYIPP